MINYKIAGIKSVAKVDEQLSIMFDDYQVKRYDIPLNEIWYEYSEKLIKIIIRDKIKNQRKEKLKKILKNVGKL